MLITENVSVTALRDLPLEEVLSYLGATPDPKDPRNWKTYRGRITVTGPKFYNHEEGGGGGGAIDLIMHMEGLSFSEALSRLAGIAGSPRTVATPSVSAPRSPSLLPVPAKENWSQVRKYLTETRRVGTELVDRLHGEGWIYSDLYKNAVFVNEKRTGAELRGTGATSFHGYRGEKAPFRLGGNTKEVAFVESAIDAMSLRELGFDGVILSFGGAAKGLIQEQGRLCQDQELTVYGAFDNDSTGENFFKILQKVVPTVKQMIPMGKDWNEELYVFSKF